jgi:hypothetical protein
MKKIILSLLFLCLFANTASAQFNVIGGFDFLKLVKAIASDTTGTFREAVRDSVTAWIARSDSSLFPNGKLSIAEIQQLSVRLGELLLKAAADDSTWAALARADSTKYPDSSLSVLDVNQLTTRLGELVLKVVVGDSVYAALARGDSSKFTDGTLSLSDINQLTTRLGNLLLLSAAGDSANAAIARNTTHMLKTASADSVYAALARGDSSKYGNGSMAIADVNQLGTRLSEKQLATAEADSNAAWLARQTWQAPVARLSTTWFVPPPTFPDTLKSSLDSLTVLALADVANLPYEYAEHLHAFGNGSAAVDSVFLVKLFLPVAANPDTVFFWIRSSAANEDSASVVVQVTQKSGSTDTPFTSVNLAASVVNTWQRYAYVFTDFETGAYVLIVRFRLRMAQTMNISPIWFK